MRRPAPGGTDDAASHDATGSTCAGCGRTSAAADPGGRGRRTVSARLGEGRTRGPQPMRRRSFVAAAASLALAAPSVRGAERARVLRFVPNGEPPVLDPITNTGAGDPHPRHHGLGHAVRHGRRLPAAAADAGGPRGGAGRQAVDADAAARPEIPRRRAGAGAGRDGQPAPVGGGGWIGPRAVRADGRVVRAGRPHRPLPAARAVPPAADGAGQDVAEPRRDHARPADHRAADDAR